LVALSPAHRYIYRALVARAVIGAERLRAIEANLCQVTPPDAFRLDVPGWFTRSLTAGQ